MNSKFAKQKDVERLRGMLKSMRQGAYYGGVDCDTQDIMQLTLSKVPAWRPQTQETVIGVRIFCGDVSQVKPSVTKHAITKGRAKGIPWLAGLSDLDEGKEGPPFLVWIAYSGPLINLLTPKRIPSIIEKLEKLVPSYAEHLKTVEEETSNNTQTETLKLDFPPMKALGIAATVDREPSIYEWERNRRYKQRDKNPILAGGLKGTTVKVFFGGKQEDKQTFSSFTEPKNVEELRAFLQSAFGGPAYAALLGLTWEGKRTGKSTFVLKFTELSRRIYGDRPSKMQSKKLWQTIQALDRATIVMETHNKGGGVSEYRIFPLTIFGVDWKTEDKQRPPKSLRVRVFDAGADNGRNAGFIAIPETVFSLNANQLALASYVLLEKQHARAGYPIKAEIGRAMQAAGLVRTWNNDPKGAKKRMREKLAALHQAGLIEPFVRFDGGYIILSEKAHRGDLSGETS